LAASHRRDERIRIAARFGIKPLEAQKMTDREIELWIDGCLERQDHEREMAAWIVCNLNNVHLKRSSHQKVEDLLSKDHRQRRMKRVGKTPEREEEELQEQASMLFGGLTPKEKMQRMRDRVRRKQQREEAKDFWESDAARRIDEILGEE